MALGAGSYPEPPELEVFTICSKCCVDLYEGDEVYDYEGEIFCSEECLHKALDVKVKYLERDD